MIDENVEVHIGENVFAGWQDLEIKLSMDSFDMASFRAPFDPKSKKFRDLFRPFSFLPLTVTLNGDRLFTGTLIGVDPERTSGANTVTISAYAQPGVLCDCTTPSGFGRKGRQVGPIKLEFLKKTLREIATQLCEPFGIPIEFRGNTGAPFEKVAIKIDEKIHSFLVELAKQRGFVMTNDAQGKLVFWKALKQAVPVMEFIEGEPPFTGIKSRFSPQEYYSEITGYAPARHKKPGTRYTFRNPWLGEGIDAGKDPINTHRPMSCKFDDTERVDAPDATRAKMGRMFANMAAFEIEDLPTWRDEEGKLWNPNTIVTVNSPSGMIYRDTELLIREVTLRRTAGSLTASLGLVLPGAFSGLLPERLPWMEPEEAA